MKLFISLVLAFSTLLGNPYEALRRGYDAPPSEKEAPFQIDALRETLRRAESQLTLDEELRRRISSLYESNQLNRTTEVEELLAIALDRFNRNQELIAQYKAESEELALLHELANDSEKMVLYATQFEESVGLKSWPKDKFRCGMTARAILYHFLQNRDPAEIRSLMRTPIRSMEALKNQLELTQNHSKARWIYVIDSFRLDHVFLIMQMEDGSFRMLQSFVNRYSLKAELANLPALSYEDVQEIISKIEILDQASEWSEELDTLYEELFQAPAPHYMTEEFSQGKPDFKFVAIPL